MKKCELALVVLLLLMSGCKPVSQVSEEKAPLQFMLTTEDNIKIAADYYQGTSDKAVILLHMLRKNKESWKDFPERLRKEGYSVLAIDLRGHGESDLDMNEFSDADFNNMVLDVRIAKKFLDEKGIREVAIIGASIGANVAVNFAKEYSGKIVLLSPGLEYHGVKTEDAITKTNTSFLIIATEGDAYSAYSSKILKEKAKNAKLIIFSGNEHGTEMFERHPLAENIIEWLR